MRYISTRDNHEPVSAAEAIRLGMVPEGGLFVPETIPLPDFSNQPAGSYQDAARRILSPLLPDFPAADLELCISRAYSGGIFDSGAVVDVVPLDANRSVMELWHGPTAAFKDVALQIMPHFLAAAKRITNDASHTVILVATSGDTGKAALEGFKNCEGISIIVFYPHGGVSEIQRLQMATTDGGNTHVVAVRGNFDQCQTEVKRLLGDLSLRARFRSRGCEFSSANSINWGRLCPQIVYYWTSYRELVKRNIIRDGDPVNVCVPTGNFGNILAGYYALRMGLPLAKLFCASNKNNVLADFFTSGRYISTRPFFRTMSPSMDILVSSNLERFLYEVTGHDGPAVAAWMSALADKGAFSVSESLRQAMAGTLVSGWVDEPDVLATIEAVFKRTGYVLDPHTAVGVTQSGRADTGGRHTIIASTASPYKFSRHVLAGMTGESVQDEFQAIDRISRLSGMAVHRALSGLRDRPVLHDLVIERSQVRQTVIDIVSGIGR